MHKLQAFQLVYVHEVTTHCYLLQTFVYSYSVC